MSIGVAEILVGRRVNFIHTWVPQHRNGRQSLAVGVTCCLPSCAMFVPPRSSWVEVGGAVFSFLERLACFC